MRQTKIWNKLFVRVFITNACMYLAQQMNNALIAKYATHLGATPTVVGAVVGTFAVTALLFKVFTGSVIDFFNRRYVLMLALALISIAFFANSLSYSVPALMAVRLLQGIGQTFSTTCCLALASDTLPPEKLGSGIGVFSMAQAASQALGPTLSLTLAERLGYNATFAISGCIMIAATIIASGIKTPYVKKGKFKVTLKNSFAKEALLPASISFSLMTAFCLINSFLILYAESLGVKNIGYYYTVYAGTLLITRPLVGRLTDRFGLVKILIPAMLVFAGALFFISYCRSLPMFLLAAFISAFGYGASQPAIQTLAMKLVPKERRGASGSTNYIGMDLGNLVGPVLGGRIVELAGYPVMWRSMTFPIIIAMIIVLVSRSRIMSAESEFRQSEFRGNKAAKES